MRKRTMAVHRWTRYAIQVAFFVLAPGLFSGAFNGVKYLFAQIGAVQGMESNSFVVLLIVTVAFTVLFGRFFCGYACAFGTLGDILFHAFDYLRSKTPVPRLKLPLPLVRALSLVKYGVLVGVCAACVFGVWQGVSGMSPWVAFAGFTSGSLDGIQAVAFVLLGLVVVGMILRERFFCQFLCPMGAVFSLLPVLGFSEFTRRRQHCAKKCGRCQETCPVDIWPDADTLVHGECVACGRCADACPLANVNLVALQKGEAGEETADPKPLRKTKETWHLLRGTETGVVAAKALVLFAVCWVVGSTRFVPSFTDVFGQGVWPFW